MANDTDTGTYECECEFCPTHAEQPCTSTATFQIDTAPANIPIAGYSCDTCLPSMAHFILDVINEDTNSAQTSAPISALRWRVPAQLDLSPHSPHSPHRDV